LRFISSPVTDDESSHVHGVLTADNLFDGTISTSHEHFYIEPSHKYSKELPKSGVHSIIYKLSDVKVNANHRDHHAGDCASEKLFRKLQRERENNLLNEEKSSRLTNENNVNEKSDLNLNALNLNGGVISSRLSDNHEDKLDVVKRFKRWLSDEEVREPAQAYQRNARRALSFTFLRPVTTPSAPS
jgi:hypothetical protein